MKKVRKGKKCIVKKCHQLQNTYADFLAHCPKTVRILLFVGALILGLTGGVYVYAKYYSVSAREGIAIATGVYFTANYAAEGEDYVESLVDIVYKGGDSSFDFEIRNYENNLLFNTSDVDIPYTIEFWLESEIIDGAIYSVSDGDGGNYTLLTGEENKVTIADQSINGGMAQAKAYTIGIDAPGDSGHVPIPIYVRVRTLEGSLVSRVLTGKVILSTTGRAESYIESQGFVIPEEPEGKTEFERLNSLSALTYEILTVGAVSNSGDSTEEIKLSWDSTVLSIDLFDAAYMSWLEEDSNRKAPTDEGNGWYSITIQAMPYSAENIVFFRGKDYATKATDLETLHTYVKAEKTVTVLSE